MPFAFLRSLGGRMTGQRVGLPRSWKPIVGVIAAIELFSNGRWPFRCPRRKISFGRGLCLQRGGDGLVSGRIFSTPFKWNGEKEHGDHRPELGQASDKYTGWSRATRWGRTASIAITIRLKERPISARASWNGSDDPCGHEQWGWIVMAEARAGDYRILHEAALQDYPRGPLRIS